MKIISDEAEPDKVLHGKDSWSTGTLETWTVSGVHKKQLEMDKTPQCRLCIGETMINRPGN
ncbi:hypothetical protein N7486_005856 [Penicillium sp. IBT 16267x]|nr:hypothetical protein N7486_005856 [Penicillium sp. IBT 16267x]